MLDLRPIRVRLRRRLRLRLLVRLIGLRGPGGDALRPDLEQEDRSSHRRVERVDATAHRDPNEQVETAARRRREASPFPADHQREGAAEVGLAVRERCSRVRADGPQPARVQFSERFGEVVHLHDRHVLARARGRLDGDGAEWRSPARWDDDAVDAGRLGAAEECAEVARVLDGVQDEHERGFAALDRAGEDIIERRPASRRDHERDTLMAVETGDRRQCPALDLDDRYTRARGMGNERLERSAPLRDDEKPASLASRRESLFDGAPPGDELVIAADEVGATFWLAEELRRFAVRTIRFAVAARTVVIALRAVLIGPRAVVVAPRSPCLSPRRTVSRAAAARLPRSIARASWARLPRAIPVAARPRTAALIPKLLGVAALTVGGPLTRRTVGTAFRAALVEAGSTPRGPEASAPGRTVKRATIPRPVETAVIAPRSVEATLIAPRSVEATLIAAGAIVAATRPGETTAARGPPIARTLVAAPTAAVAAAWRSTVAPVATAVR